ncbi:hypothetical protein BDU57DRAFT_513360 [Ampelomyces quisqualis]|uniref:Uncharacterized protein n=1 Tax=Ampelomyces quisqualis TaxID=50730 RepID=A0A6A5QNJ0_AMPQU|nr:hypothetical protein BDU57DRAFT_513360 [Ampelomyces quisqualis]
MAKYIDAGTQTKWAGIMQRDTVRPDIPRAPPLDTTTPPDDMITQKEQHFYGIPSIRQPTFSVPNAAPPAPSLLERRQNRVGLTPHIPLPPNTLPSDLPPSELHDDVPRSPATTHALLSPLPEANKRHAGHTPLIPRALSPEPEAAAEMAQQEAARQEAAEDRVATPDLDEALSGALTLPSNPVDGAADHIELDALDKILGKIAKQQTTLRGEFDDEDSKPEPKTSPKAETVDTTEDSLPLSRKGSADSRRSGATEEVDGVILKSPPSNFGAPLGSL